jgi:hypothetical protein
LVFEKTSTCFRSRGGSGAAVTSRFCSSVDLVQHLGDRLLVALLRATSMVSGSVRKLLASFLISGEKVAENIRFWRFFGSRLMMRCRSGRKPMSSMRSASSITSICTWPRLMFFCSTWSSRRPGVAMTISTPRRRISVCGFMSMPPKTTVERSGVCWA